MTATDAHEAAQAQLNAAMAAGDDTGARAWRRVLRDLDAGDPITVDGWLLVPLDLGDAGPVCIAVRDRRAGR